VRIVRSLDAFRARSITSLVRDDRETILSLFSTFESKLGPVGTAKALNLIALSFFPLWDNPISSRYGVLTCGYGYLVFILISKYQVERLYCLPNDSLPLKMIDEYNYCKYTKGWV